MFFWSQPHKTNMVKHTFAWRRIDSRGLESSRFFTAKFLETNWDKLIPEATRPPFPNKIREKSKHVFKTTGTPEKKLSTNCLNDYWKMVVTNTNYGVHTRTSEWNFWFSWLDGISTFFIFHFLHSGTTLILSEHWQSMSWSREIKLQLKTRLL